MSRKGESVTELMDRDRSERDQVLLKGLSAGRRSMPAKEIISSASVHVFEGTANELVPKAKLPRDMHGFAIVVPGGEDHEWKLDLLWRVAILYAAQSRILKSRTKVAKIVEAVMRAAERPRSEFENSVARKVMKPSRSASQEAAKRLINRSFPVPRVGTRGES